MYSLTGKEKLQSRSSTAIFVTYRNERQSKWSWWTGAIICWCGRDAHQDIIRADKVHYKKFCSSSWKWCVRSGLPGTLCLVHVISHEEQKAKFISVLTCMHDMLKQGGLRNGMVAVKKLSISMDFSDTQFLEEVKCLKRVRHKNIVRFLGYCADTHGEVMEIEGKLRIVEVQQRLLCFEYVPNGSLHQCLQGINIATLFLQTYS